MGAHAVRATTREEIERALEDARRRDGVSAIVIPVDREKRVPGYESWWDVPVAEVSTLADVRRARAEYEEAKRQRVTVG
jgi:3D-(3,5/4)-trihydroxycyclohexane-1,2-dione acylhydrolase (decyclizing)